MRGEKGAIGVALLLSGSLLESSLAGTLGGFEDAVAEPVSHSDHKDPSSRSEEDHPDGSETGDKIASGVVAALIMKSPDDVAAVDDDYDAGELEGIRHEIGTPGAPYVRFDYRWQYLDSDSDANDYLLEVGYKYAAFYGRFTRYEDRAANEDLNIEQYYGMLRYGGTDEFFFPGSFQIGAGVGGYLIEGKDSQSGAALTIPVMLYPADWFGIEFRPAWASINEKAVSDYDISVSAGQRFFHLRAGYRWLWVRGEGHWLNGPYAGMTLSF